jgi:transposase
MNPDDLNRAFPQPAMAALPLARQMQDLTRRLDHLDGLIRALRTIVHHRYERDLIEIPGEPGEISDRPQLPELELQHRAFVARIREREEG